VVRAASVKSEKDAPRDEGEKPRKKKKRKKKPPE